MPESTVHIIDDDEAIRDSLSFLLTCVGLTVRTYDSAAALLRGGEDLAPGCIITDVRMPEINGLELLKQLRDLGIGHPVIVISGHGDIPLAVEAMKAGVLDFLEKPIDEDLIVRTVRRALTEGSRSRADHEERGRLKAIFATLSPREQQVLQGVVDGKLNKVIAHELGISPRTIDVHRANMMSKTGAHGLSELVRMVLAARHELDDERHDSP
jgi:two-component system response regulator FixJ